MQIFVSHSSQDNQFCEKLVSALRQAGADVWYDQHNLQTGVLLQEINQQLVDRPVFIVILSQAALQSQWVRNECQWAFMLTMQDPNRVILPVLAEHLAETDLHTLLFLSGYKRIERPGQQPYAPAEAIRQVLHTLVLSPSDDDAPPPAISAIIERRRSQATTGVPLQILWVDDRPSNTIYERRILEAMGITCTMSTNTDEALGKIIRNQYDAIISDMGRPPDQHAGYTLLEELNRLEIYVPYIIYAGSDAPDHQLEAIRRGAVGSVGNDRQLFALVQETLKLG